MRYARLASASAVLFSLSLMVACGGGGGNAPTPPGNPAPGPSVTVHPSGSPTTTPSGGPTATSTPTSAPTHTPTPTPTGTATASPGPTPTGNSTLTVLTGDGEINGTDDQFISSARNQHNNAGEGDLEPNDPGALPQGGGQGPVGAGFVDNIPCNQTMSSDYHVHLFVGIMYNGQEIALPDAIGIDDPFGEFTDNTDPQHPIPNQEIYGDCFYFVHTHDASGLVHLEAPSSWTGAPPCSGAANPPYSTLCTQSYFTLADLLNVWGLSMTQSNFGPLVGPVSVYSTPDGYWQCNPGPCYRSSNQYQLVADPGVQGQNVKLWMHSVIWIVVGTQPNRPASLPNIEWINGGGS